MESGLERIVNRRAMPWQLVLPSQQAEDRDTDAYGRPVRTVMPQTLEFRGFSEPLGESKTGQHDIGHITRGDEVLWVTRSGVEDLGVFKVGMEVIDIAGGRWGIVAIDDFTGKLHPGEDGDSSFVRLQITKKAIQ